MKGADIINRFASYLKRQSPTILTCMGAVGVVATAVTAVKATPKAMVLIQQERMYKFHRIQTEGGDTEEVAQLAPLEMVRVAWKCYIPSIAIGTATIACIFSANVLNKHQQAVVTSAYMFLEQSYKEYKNKVAELYGENANSHIRGEIVKDKYTPSDFSQIGDTLIFYEEHYGKFFERTMLEVQDAEYQLNRKFVLDGEASVNDFLELLDLPKTEIGDSLGWSLEAGCAFYGYSWIDFEHELIQMDDGMECYVINLPNEPTIGYNVPF